MLGRPWRMTGYLIFPWIGAYSSRFWSGLVQSNGGVRILSDTKGRFWTILRNSCLSKSLKLCLILYYMKPWNGLRSHHFASCKKNNPRLPPPLKNYGVHTINPQLCPCIMLFLGRFFLTFSPIGSQIVSSYTQQCLTPKIFLICIVKRVKNF